MSSGKIPGRPLLGFSDFFDGDDVYLGAAGPTMAGPKQNVFQRRPTPGPAKVLPAGGGGKTVASFQKIVTKKAPKSKAASPYKVTFLSAISAGKRAIDLGKKAAVSAQKTAKIVKAGKLGPLLPVKATSVRGDGTVALGAATRKPLTPAQKAAVGRHVKLVGKRLIAGKRLADLAKKAQVAGQGALSAAKSGALGVKAAYAPKWNQARTRVKGYVEIGGELYAVDLLGAEPDPENPGFLTDGSIDPAMVDPGFVDPAFMDPGGGADPYAAMDTGSGAVTTPDGQVLYDPRTDPAVVPMPIRGQILSPEEANQSFDNVPEDGIPYDGSRGLPENCVGSWNAFYGGTKHEGWGVPSFLRGSVDGGRTIQWLYCAPETADKGFQVAGREFQTTATSGAPSAQAVSTNSLQRGWGPVVGNPRDPLLAGLQYAIKDGVWFWQGKNAPVWATQEADSKIAQANKKTTEANRAAALVVAAQMNAELLARQEAQAKQDAANALALSAADTQTEVVQRQLDAQQAQLDMQTQKAELDLQNVQAQQEMQRQQAELDYARAQAQNEAAQQAALIEQTTIWNTWAKENPEEAMAQLQQQGPVFDDGSGADFSDGNQGAGSYGYDPFEGPPVYEEGGYGGGYEGGAYSFEGGGGEGEAAEGELLEDD